MPEPVKVVTIKLVGKETTDKGLRVLKSAKASYYLSKWCKWQGVEWETLRKGQTLHLTMSADGQWVREVRAEPQKAAMAPAAAPAVAPKNGTALPPLSSLRETALRLAATAFAAPHADIERIEEIAQALVAAASIFEAYLAGGEVAGGEELPDEGEDEGELLEEDEG